MTAGEKFGIMMTEGLTGEQMVRYYGWYSNVLTGRPMDCLYL